MKTKVVFRKYPQGDVIALFPDEPGDSSGVCSCYQHIGQHGSADYTYTIGYTSPATEPEYRALKAELEASPYNYELDVYG